METVARYWKSFVDFLTEYKIEKLSELVRNLDWGEVVKNPIVWVCTLTILGLIIWKQQFKLLILMASGVAFVFLLQFALPPPGQSLQLMELLKFVGGTISLLAINVYFLIIRT